LGANLWLTREARWLLSRALPVESSISSTQGNAQAGRYLWSKEKMSQRLYSAQGHLLVDAPIKDRPVLTVELYTKWYVLHLVEWSGLITKLDFPDERYAPPGESAYVDHVPNPKAMENYALEHGYDVGEFALELITGRWHLETT
jgi:hypothetical protein